MKQQKKQYRPIAGQRWYEKFLDLVTREENYWWFIIAMVVYVALFAVGGYISANVLKRPDITDLISKLWFGFFPIVAAAAIFNPLSAGWSLRAEKKLQKPIEEYIETRGCCTYDELVVQCMPLKIHLGIDSAIETMLQHRELVLEEDGRYRLPTDEDRKKWREEDLAEYGVKISFEDLEKIFTLDLKELEESIDIEFSLGERDGYWMGKAEDEGSGADIFWLMVGTGDRRDYTTFQELVTAKLFDGQSLESVWDDVVLTFINDQQMTCWLNEHLS